MAIVATLYNVIEREEDLQVVVRFSWPDGTFVDKFYTFHHLDKPNLNSLLVKVRKDRDELLEQDEARHVFDQYIGTELQL